MIFTSKQVRFLLELINKQYGPGWVHVTEGDVEVGQVQALLSIMLEALTKLGK